MGRKEKAKIIRLCRFILNMQTMDMTSDTLLLKRIGRVYPWPSVLSMAITVDTKFNKHMSVLTSQLRYLLANTGPLESFALRTPAFEEEVDFTPTDKQRIFRAIARHPLLVLELSEIPFKDLIYLARGFIDKDFPELRSLSLMNVLPSSRGTEDTLGIITKGFSEAESVEELKVSIMHTNIEEAVQLVKVLHELPNIQSLSFSFPLFTKAICAAYLCFFEKPQIRQITTYAYEYNDTCMYPFEDVYYLVPNLKSVEFCCLKSDGDVECKLIEMDAFFRAINCSCLQQFTLRNICVKDIHENARLLFSKTSIVKRLKLQYVCSMQNVVKFLSSAGETPNVEELGFSLMLCSPPAVEALRRCLSMATSLVHISLENCRMLDQHFVSLRPARLFRKAKTLKLRGNYLRYSSLIQIIEILKTPHTEIEHLDITDLDAPADKISEIFNAIHSHPTLKTFLWNCIYASLMYDNLYAVVKDNVLIERLSMRHVNVSPANVFKAMKMATKLQWISFGATSFDHIAIRKLWKLCEKNRTLKLLKLNLTRTNFSFGSSFDYFFNELMKRLKPKEIAVTLKKFSREDREYKMKIRMIKKLIFSVIMNVEILEKYVKQWWNFKMLHSVIIGDSFITAQSDWARWITEYTQSEKLRETVIFYLY
eukprot:TRINITY_DN13490_c0_g1_i8.p1 TRINITY_DN13490_c0_g1~~TRINITY_DN13490_c0_g1_i8.p1  ORF type:complete len:651 (+),score=136.92 TRINITY_DN13490_c0_g1_i8:126-2078(+)